MSRCFEGGGGNPIAVMDIGGGDSEAVGGMYLSGGGGDPYCACVDATLSIMDADVVPRMGVRATPSRAPDYRYSQAGGYILLASSGGLPLPDGDYYIRLVAANGKKYPAYKPGANSALFGYSQRCQTVIGGRFVQFALPAAPVGTYDIEVTAPNGIVSLADEQVVLTYVPESRQMRGICRAPGNLVRPVLPMRTDDREVSLPAPSNTWGSVAYAFAHELQHLHGHPEFSLRSDLAPSGTTMQVTSTLGLDPAGGYIAGAGRVFKYLSCDNSYNGQTVELDPDWPEFVRGDYIPVGTLFIFKTESIVPSRYTWSVDDPTPYP